MYELSKKNEQKELRKAVNHFKKVRNPAQPVFQQMGFRYGTVRQLQEEQGISHEQQGSGSLKREKDKGKSKESTNASLLSGVNFLSSLAYPVQRSKKAAKAASKTKSKRLQYMGKTPGKKSKTGREVIETMEANGQMKTVSGEKRFKASDKKWYPIKEADMAHTIDAVSWWNKTGRKYGAKAKEVREFMLDPDHYVLDHFSINRSQGAQLGQQYKPPLK